jgi:hypothetical protein
METFGLTSCAAEIQVEIILRLDALADIFAVSVLSTQFDYVCKNERIWENVANSYLDVWTVDFQQQHHPPDSLSVYDAGSTQFSWQRYCRQIFTMSDSVWEGQGLLHTAIMSCIYPVTLYTKTGESFLASGVSDSLSKMESNDAASELCVDKDRFRISTRVYYPYLPAGRTAFHAFNLFMTTLDIAEGLCVACDASVAGEGTVEKKRKGTGHAIEDVLNAPITVDYFEKKCLASRAPNRRPNVMLEWSEGLFVRLFSPRLPFRARNRSINGQESAQSLARCDSQPRFCFHSRGIFLGVAFYPEREVFWSRSCVYFVLKDVAFGYGIFRQWFLSLDENNKAKEYFEHEVDYRFQGQCLFSQTLPYPLICDDAPTKLLDSTMDIFTCGWDASLQGVRVTGTLNSAKFVGLVAETYLARGEDSNNNANGLSMDLLPVEEWRPTRQHCAVMKGIYLTSASLILRWNEQLAKAATLQLLDAKYFASSSNFDFVCEVRGECLVGISEKQQDTNSGRFSFCLREYSSVALKS